MTKEKRKDTRTKIELSDLFPKVASLAASREWSIPKASIFLIRQGCSTIKTTKAK